MGLWGQPALATLIEVNQPAAPSGPIVQTASLEQQAQIAYEQARYQAAAQLLDQVQQHYQAAGQQIEQAVALSNLSLTYQQLGNWPAAQTVLEQAWETLSHQTAPKAVEAQVLDVQGQLEFAQGNLDNALNTWETAANRYGQLGDRQRQALSQLHQVQVLQAKGLFQQVLRRLTSLEKELANQPDSPPKAMLLRQLGDNLRATGRLEPAQAALQQSLAVANRLQAPAQVAATTLSLGNLEQARFKFALEKQGQTAAVLAHANAALNFYQSAAIATGTVGVQARLNVMQLLTHPAIAQWDTAIALLPTLQDRLAQLPPGRTAIYGYAALVENLIVLKEESDRGDPSWSDIRALLNPAQVQAEALGDIRAQSFVLGTLGHVDEQIGQWSTAEALSREALTLAQSINATDIIYRWQWQLGRTLKAQNQNPAAISAYSEAFAILKDIRSDLVTANPDVRFSFRDNVEPIYRQLVSLLLNSVPNLQDLAPAQSGSISHQNYLRQARDVIEALQLAELENYFQAACIEQTVSIDQIVDERDTTAAVVYAILLADRLEVVLKLPQQKNLVHYTASATRATVDDTLSQFRAALVTGNAIEDNGRRLYDWLLRPAVDQGLISPETIQTLIFVLDGNLRLIPMATLHDGEGYLIEKYATSLLLGLEIQDPQPLPAREDMAVLAASLTTPPPAAADTYGKLDNVNEELDKIAATNLSATFLRDQAFTKASLEQQLQSDDYTIVHLATHGQFGSDRQRTFILAADGRIDVDTLGQLFSTRRSSESIEMLILSACKTATGNSREVLGIAGATVQAGAKSSIATLWSIDDDASVLFTETLYGNLGKPGISRAEALRQAQLALLKQFPGRSRYWAPYVLVGNWR